MTENNDKKTVTLTVEEYDELIAKADSQNSEAQSTADPKKPKVKTGHLSSMINYSDRF